MNVLIIDDEQLIRENVYHHVMSLNLGIDKVFLADGAEDARNILKDNEINIFLCDIVMPEEDGISFARWVLIRYPDSKFIFLTSYSDFEYMKEAISLQSFDYILQPAPVEELEDVLARAIIQIKLEENNRKLLEEASFLREQDSDILEILGGRYLLRNAKDSEFFDRYLKQTWEQMPKEASYFSFYMKVLSSDREWASGGRALLRSIYGNIINEIMAPLSMKSAVFLDDELSGDALVLLYSESRGQEDINEVIKALETMRILYQKLLNTETTIYAAGFCRYDEIRESVAGILNEMKNIVRDVSCVCLTGTEEKRSGRDLLAVQVNSWRVLLNQNKVEDFHISLMRYLDRYTEGYAISRDFLIRLHQQVSELILGKIVASELKTDEIFDETLSYYDFMYCTKDFRLFRDVISGTIERLSRKLKKKERDPIEETIRYIHENIDRDISVRELAEMVGVSPEYFTRLFKKSTGMNLKRYIVNEKMEAAKLLLTTTNLSVTTISGHVGYPNYSNFSHTFKLLFQETPTEYRSKYGQEDDKSE